MMPGVYLVDGERVVWQHTYQHVGDHPDWGKIPGLAKLRDGDEQKA
jgi:hypothetical protein